MGSHIRHEYAMSVEWKAANMALLMSLWAETFIFANPYDAFSNAVDASPPLDGLGLFAHISNISISERTIYAPYP
jgi:hypothetical protein